ncbi:MAG: hypothetical protein OEW67_14095, partial [Cyclobacteriaceae bacterium]|nr:hypothetical protein [Cyclobacteriaceae bacterium]
KYKIRDQDKPYFITISVVEWIDVFTRPIYKEIVIDSLQYCQKKGWEFMHCEIKHIEIYSK